MSNKTGELSPQTDPVLALQSDLIEEWLDAIADVYHEAGEKGVCTILRHLTDFVFSKEIPFSVLTTPYVNTLSVNLDLPVPEIASLEKLIAAIRWNAVMMVLRAGRHAPELGGHIASYQSAALLYEIGFNYFFRGNRDQQLADLVFIQGHSSPGIYARAFLEGRLSETQIAHFRQEIECDGITSYPHAYLMPNFWQFSTVSMGLGPVQAIYQARFLRYLEHRGLMQPSDRKIWAFLGDGESDEPESLGALSIAGREKLDNLIFVVNCNLQRLDGPVRGNGKIIQELEGIFNGARWEVIKVVWSSEWDLLLAQDDDGLLKKNMMDCVDGDYQSFKPHDGADLRQRFFGRYSELSERVQALSDTQLGSLARGGHDPVKVFAAYQRAVAVKNKPVVILLKTIKGYGMGDAGEGQNITHQQKKMTEAQLRTFRDRFQLPLSDEAVKDLAFYQPEPDSDEMKFLRKQRDRLGGFVPERLEPDHPLTVPPLSLFDPILKGSGDRTISTTMAFVRALGLLLRDKHISKHIVPIVPDECRTFGMEGMFRQYGIYAAEGQLYQPEDSDSMLFYKEAKDGQLLEEGLNEAGAFCSWLAAATAYSNHALPMIPFFIYYSMFGFQRIGDLAWAAGDSLARGFLLGGTAGRTTLAGEGLQHQDGHSHILANTIPNCVTYDPAYAYELAVILQAGLQRMYVDQENVFYYITVMNENYLQPAIPEGVEAGILRGMYCLEKSTHRSKITVDLLGCGTILREVQSAKKILEADYGVAANVWSVTSFNELARDAMAVTRHNRLHFKEKRKKQSFVQQCLGGTGGPVIAATDYMRLYADQIRSEIVGRAYTVLGTDGFGRSDTRAKLRHFFEVDTKAIVWATMSTLFEEGQISANRLETVFTDFNIDLEKQNPWSG